jgi:hypothetical protein
MAVSLPASAATAHNVKLKLGSSWSMSGRYDHKGKSSITGTITCTGGGQYNVQLKQYTVRGNIHINKGTVRKGACDGKPHAIIWNSSTVPQYSGFVKFAGKKQGGSTTTANLKLAFN